MAGLSRRDLLSRSVYVTLGASGFVLRGAAAESGESPAMSAATHDIALNVNGADRRFAG